MNRRNFLSTVSAALASRVAEGAPRSQSKRRVSLNQDWRFTKGDPQGSEAADFNDSSWRQLDLPHDWAIEGPFDPTINAHCGGLPYFGVAWYRKRFTIPAASKGRYFGVEFDGAMSNSKVWLNGKELGGRPYGYIGFAFDLTPALKFGDENVLAVRLAPEVDSSRWYPGAGIYRNVWLDSTGPVHVARWGTYVTTPEVTDANAKVLVKTEIRNRDSQPARVTLETTIVNAAGKTVGRARGEYTAPATAEQTIEVANPKRWDIDSPYLYEVVSTIRSGHRALDRYTTPLGIRTIQFDVQKGFLLNGRHLKLKGVCNHHDLGALGTAVSRRATERQLEIMKSMGGNAIRTSHNPPSPELLEFCDRLGLLVMDEAFDMWHIPKVKNGYAKYFDEWGDTDIRDMVRRDRNHPSIVLWSIGNEIPEQGKADGWEIAKRLADICHKEDPTRLVTAGFNNWTGAIKNKLADQVDVPGFNYKPMHYRQILDEHPKWVIVGSETASCVSSRGVYHLPIEKYEKHPSLQLTSYDIIAPSWAYAPDPEFAAQDELPQVAGQFVWTGFDYLGEPTPFNQDHRKELNPDWPSRSSYFGIVDLCGFPKDRYYLYQSVWSEKPMVHILPHWNWAGSEGQKIPVFCYTNCDEAELFLNGRSLGKKARFSEPVEIPAGPNISETKKFMTKYRLKWDVPYEPGVLRVAAYQKGTQAAAKEVHTAGPPARVSLTPDRTRIAADGQDLCFVTVRIEDQQGQLCPTADDMVRFRVEGAGRIAAVDNGNAATTEPFQADHRKAFSGMCLLIVQSKRGARGQIRISANSDGLHGAATSVAARS